VDEKTVHRQGKMGDVLTLVTRPEQTQEDIKNLFMDISDRINHEDAEKRIDIKKAVVLMLDDTHNSSEEDHYDFTMVSANLSTSELVGLLEIAKHKAFEITSDG